MSLQAAVEVRWWCCRRDMQCETVPNTTSGDRKDSTVDNRIQRTIGDVEEAEHRQRRASMSVIWLSSSVQHDGAAQCQHLFFNLRTCVWFCLVFTKLHRLYYRWLTLIISLTMRFLNLVAVTRAGYGTTTSLGHQSQNLCVVLSCQIVLPMTYPWAEHSLVCLLSTMLPNQRHLPTTQDDF